ncbi:hypothetical protein [Bradyrhizobium sp. WD16]|uniref:hypothetical protein n=1 Tax=Bradyrhizobium sp. WD16 TaxID=1521768 RepID=UPI0020A5D7D6|nr:hypothetical protein [Bradyrhizobium sp. WD16]UTD29890.1 hypothetical protein DB459_26255 [Bradyrhizobium sp. WD16]
MQDNPKDRLALPLKGYQLVDNTLDPTLVGIAFETEQGPFMFVANREILETLSKAFKTKAAAMPKRKA